MGGTIAIRAHIETHIETHVETHVETHGETHGETRTETRGNMRGNTRSSMCRLPRRRLAAALTMSALALSTVPLECVLLEGVSLGSVAFASGRDDARDAKLDSASAVIRPGDPRANAPATKSLPRQAISPGSATHFDSYPSVSGVTEATADEKLLVQLINVERTSRGLKPVVWDGVLSGLARMHGADMRAVRKATHNSSADGATFGARLARTPYRASAAAENVAYNADVVHAHRALMASPGHRRNILDPALTVAGIAVLTDSKDDWVWVVEDFATPIAHISDAQAEQIVRDSLTGSRSWRSSLPEDKELSKRLDEMVEDMIATGKVSNVVGDRFGAGWALAYTSLDPTKPPPAALERAAKAEGYALAVSFRKTPRYPFGAYWAILFLKGTY